MPTIISFLSFVFVVISNGGTYQVTTRPDAVTWYDIAYSYPSHTIGILAHEDLAGAAFYELRQGDTITLDSTDYTVTDILKYTASDPNSIYSYFIGADDVAIDPVTMGQLIYNSGHRLIHRLAMTMDAGGCL